MWENIVKSGMPRMAIWPMPIACLKTKATDTHTLRIFNTYSPPTPPQMKQWLDEHASMLRLYAHFPALLKLNVRGRREMHAEFLC